MKKLFSILLIFTLIFTACGSNYQIIEGYTLDAVINDNPDYQYIDLRSTEEFEQKYIPGFENIPATDFNIDEIELDKSVPVILVNRDGDGYDDIAKSLSKKGYDVYVVNGGLLKYNGNKLTSKKES